MSLLQFWGEKTAMGQRFFVFFFGSELFDLWTGKKKVCANK